MTYSELKTAIANYSHRSDLTSDIPGFIRLCEGMIRRELNAYELTATLDEDDRDADGVYNLPSTLLQVRAVYTDDAPNGALNVGVNQLRSIASNSPVIWYSVIGDQIELRGVPATDAEIEIRYFGHPAALSADGDTNDLLTNHEGLYLYGSLFYLYQFTQDLALAQGALDTFNDIKDKLNEQHARKIGGAVTNTAAYNLGNLPRTGGY